MDDCRVLVIFYPINICQHVYIRNSIHFGFYFEISVRKVKKQLVLKTFVYLPRYRIIDLRKTNFANKLQRALRLIIFKNKNTCFFIYFEELLHKVVFIDPGDNTPK